MQVFDTAGNFIKTIRRMDASGVAPLADGLMVTDGTGAISRLGPDGLVPLQRHDLAWDNHLVALG